MFKIVQRTVWIFETKFKRNFCRGLVLQNDINGDLNKMSEEKCAVNVNDETKERSLSELGTLHESIISNRALKIKGTDVNNMLYRTLRFLF